MYNQAQWYSGYGGIAKQDFFGLAASSPLLSSASSSYYEDTMAFRADPVHIFTGELYKKIDLVSLPGPMPLQLSLNYSSQNLAQNELGYGNKLSYMPFLGLATNSTTIRAAETDGSV